MARNVAEKLEDEVEEAEVLNEEEIYEKPKAVYHDEIVAVISIAVAVLLVMSNFNMSGKVGSFVNSVLFGIFGIPAYISPIVLVFVVLIYLANKNNIFAIRKCVSAVTLLVVVCSLIQMTNFDPSTRILQFYTMSATDKSGGGIIGGLVCTFLHNLFGFGGTLVILILMAIISSIIISEKTFIKAMTKAFASITDRLNGTDYDEDVYDDYVDDYSDEDINDSDNEALEDNTEEKPRKRRIAKTFTLFSNNFDSDEDDSDNNEDEDDIYDEEDDSLDNDSKSYNDDSSDINDSKDNDAYSDNMALYEQEMSRKFGTPKELDIRNLADNIINGTLNDCDNENYSNTDELMDSNNLTFEQLTTDDVFDRQSGKMREIITPNSNSDMERTSIVTRNNLVNSNNNANNNGTNTVISNNYHSQSATTKTVKRYRKPSPELLAAPVKTDAKLAKKEQEETAMKLQSTFDSFGVGAKITNVSAGPAVTRYEVQPKQGVKVSKITNLSDDIKLNLAASDIRIEAPIPGKAAVGIEVPNKGENSTVMLRELIESKEFKKNKSALSFAVGKDISGQVVIADIAKMPHLLIAGQTGAGKSVCINTLIMSLLYKASPDDVKLIMIDPKVVELSVYNKIPHLLVPVVTDPKKAAGALNWAIAEMTERYQKFAETGVRDITSFNEKVTSIPNNNVPRYQKLPQIVIIIDELADLMMVAPGEVEDAICRLAQMARAAGLHLIIATQRPSVNVITGLIKANVPSRIAFSVASAIDSRTIIDGGGAEKLLGKGDMLFYPSGYPKPIRVQGAFVSDKEVNRVVDYLKDFFVGYDHDTDDKMVSSAVIEEPEVKKASDKDEYFIEAGRFVIEKDKASIGMLQRVYKIGFNRAARIMDQLYEAGVVSGEEGTKARKVLMTHDEFNQYIEECL